MANLSTASGEVYITAPTYEDTIKIAKLLEEGTDVSDYATYLDLNGAIINNQSKDFCEVLFPFSGFGRWAFACNIKYSGKWIKNGLQIKKKEDDVNYLESIDWKMHYEYSDYECGCMVLGEGSADVIHKAKQDLSEVEYIKFNWKDYDYTYYNIMKVNGYTIDELLEERDLLRFLDDEIEQYDSIEDFEDDLNEFISDWACDRYISKEKAKKEIYKESSDFKELMELLEG